MMLYKQAFSLGLQKAMRYRANFFFGMLSFVFPLSIQYFLWTSVFASSDGKKVFGYTLGQMLAYAVFAAVTSRIVSTGFVSEVNMEIKQGGFAKYLVRPMHYLPYEGACVLGEKIMNIFFSSILILIISALLQCYYPGTISGTGLVLYFLSMILAILLNYVLYVCFCGAAFWMRDGSGAVFIMTFVGNIVSGGIFPLDIFSRNVQMVLRSLPFCYTTYFPVSLMNGTISGIEIGKGFLGQVFWIVVMSVLTNIVWSRGTKKYTAVGG